MPFLLVSICDSSSHVTISHFRQRITIPDHVLLLYTSSKHINAICPRIKVLCRIFPQISSAYSHVPILLMSYLSKTIGKSSQWCGTKMALPCTFPVGSNQRSVPSSHSSNVTISATLPCQLQVCWKALAFLVGKCHRMWISHLPDRHLIISATLSATKKKVKDSFVAPSQENWIFESSDKSSPGQGPKVSVLLRDQWKRSLHSYFTKFYVLWGIPATSEGYNVLQPTKGHPKTVERYLAEIASSTLEWPPWGLGSLRWFITNEIVVIT